MSTNAQDVVTSPAYQERARRATRAIVPHGAIFGFPLLDVESSNVGRVGYDDARGRLYVQFRDRGAGTRDGALYEYDDVEPEVFDALLQADADSNGSVGQTFHELVRAAGYSYRRIVA